LINRYFLDCGEAITGRTYGDITSPGYPGNYPINRDCYWTIQVAPGNVIQFLFGTIAIEVHSNCTFDYLEVNFRFSDYYADHDWYFAKVVNSLFYDEIIWAVKYLFLFFYCALYILAAFCNTWFRNKRVQWSGFGLDTFCMLVLSAIGAKAVTALCAVDYFFQIRIAWYFCETKRNAKILVLSALKCRWSGGAKT